MNDGPPVRDTRLASQGPMELGRAFRLWAGSSGPRQALGSVGRPKSEPAGRLLPAGFCLLAPACWQGLLAGAAYFCSAALRAALTFSYTERDRSGRALILFKYSMAF